MAEPVQLFRDTIRLISPSWLRRTRWGGVLYSFGVHADLLVEATIEAVTRRFPGFSGAGDEIEIVGAERRIRRGRNEPDAIYTTRLRSWLDVHRLRGNPYTLLQQLHAYYADAPFKIDLIYASGPGSMGALGTLSRRFQMAVDGTITTNDVQWLDATPRMVRWWLIFHDFLTVTSDGLWDDPGTWDDGGLWDSSLTRNQAEELRAVPADMNAAHAIGYVCILPPGTVTTDFPRTIWDDQAAMASYGITRVTVHV